MQRSTLFKYTIPKKITTVLKIISLRVMDTDGTVVDLQNLTLKVQFLLYSDFTEIT